MKRQRLDLHLVPFFGDFPLSKISGFDVERYKHQRQKEAVSVRPRHKVIVRAADKITTAKPSTINRELAVLSHLFNKAIEWEWMDRRPAKINRFAEGQGRITYLTVDQITQLVECAKADGNAQIYPFIVIGLETAMRKSEILSIRREDIDLQRRVVFHPQGEGRRTRTTDHQTPGRVSGVLCRRTATGQPVVVSLTRREGPAHRGRAQAVSPRRHRRRARSLSDLSLSAGL